MVSRLVPHLGLIGLAILTAALPADEPAPALPPPQPRLFTLDADKVPVSKALDELARQTGVRVEDRRGEGDPAVAVHLRAVPFWQALDAIASAARARVYLYPRSGRITLVKAPPGSHYPPVSHDGFFRCALKKVGNTLDLESGADVCTVWVEVAWEPALQPLLLETRPQELRLVDDRGKVIPTAPEGSAQAPVNGRTSLLCEFQVPALPRSAAGIGLLEGRLAVVAPTKMLTFTFETLDRLDKAGAGGPARQIVQEGVTCRVSKLVLTPERWTVQVTLDYPPGNKQLESYQSWVVNNELALESLDGKRRVPAASYVLENATPRRAVLSYHFVDRDRFARGRPEDWRLTYRTPAAVVEWPVRFSFKDVRLP
jgi:hypothetical protein